MMKVVIGSSALLLSGCASSNALHPVAARRYCLRTGSKSQRVICSPQPIPSAQIEAAAKHFEPIFGACILYVVRSVWADRATPLQFVIDNTRQVVTLPRCLTRIRMLPGNHQLQFEWDGEIQRFTIEAQAGEVRFVEITGASTLWSAGYRWSEADPLGARQRAAGSRLIADINLDG